MMYDEDRQTPAQKGVTGLLMAVYFVGFIYIFICCTTGHLFTWSDLSQGPWLWVFLRCLAILSVFPFIGLTFFLMAENHRYEPEHKFYSDWARVFTGVGRGQHDSFSAEDIKGVQIQRTSFEDRPLFVVRVWLKPWRFPFTGKRGDVRFAIRAQDEAELDPLCQWLRVNQIVPTWSAPEEIHRRS